MNAPLIVLIALVSAVSIGIVRTLRGRTRLRAWLVALQIAAAVALYLCLFPPSTHEDFAAGELIVLTPGATPAQLAASSHPANVVALPGVDAPRDVERVPDLGTALRHHADARRLRIVGEGLSARDRDAARGLVAAFDAAALPRGIVDLDVPATVRAGAVWRVQGRVEGAPNGHVELRDPSGALVANVVLGADGRFALATPAKGAGTSSFALRAFGVDGAQIDATTLPLVAREGSPLRVLLLAGAPDAQLKYLRRWMADAGIALDSRMILSEGVALTEGDAKLDAAALANADLAIVDERAWAVLDDARKQALRAAVDDGLGLLLRATGPLPAVVAEDWKSLGFEVQASDSTRSLPMDHALGADDAQLTFAPLPLAVVARDAAALLAADDGTPLGLWRAQTIGRVGVIWFADDWRIALAGHRAAYASLWSEVFSRLARARGAAESLLPTDARVDRRAAICGVSDGDVIEDGHGARVELRIDTTDSAQSRTRCAAYWPAHAGWKTLSSAGRRWPFFVRAADDSSALVRAGRIRATRALLGAVPDGARTTRDVPLPRWPLFLAFLALVAALWWLERRAAQPH